MKWDSVPCFFASVSAFTKVAVLQKRTLNPASQAATPMAMAK